jgi:predicted MFS family arabinose efflux permease
MKFTLGLILLDGINIGVSTATMLHLLPSTDDKKSNNFNAGTCLIIYGAGCIIGGFIGGKVCDKLRINLSSMIGMFWFFMSCLFSIAAA